MHKCLLPALAGLALAVSGTGLAQTSAEHAAQPMTNVKVSVHHGHHLKARLAKLKAVLGITPAQESAWQRFVRAARPVHTAARRKMQQAAANITAPEVFDRLVRRAGRLQALAKAGNNLYSRLSSGQQAAWNEFIMKMHAGAHHRMMRMMHKMHKRQPMHGSAGDRG